MWRWREDIRVLAKLCFAAWWVEGASAWTGGAESLVGSGTVPVAEIGAAFVPLPVDGGVLAGGVLAGGVLAGGVLAGGGSRLGKLGI
jgi:hypothetical protein